MVTLRNVQDIALYAKSFSLFKNLPSGVDKAEEIKNGILIISNFQVSYIFTAIFGLFAFFEYHVLNTLP